MVAVSLPACVLDEMLVGIVMVWLDASRIRKG